MIARKIYRTMESRLEEMGEITEVETEWSSFTDTLELVFNSK